ncbi:hypothetical protein Tsp_05419 [Trichinella spiralis]|uniref:hypothetical protein n=1 Tax=Trichinella spiralis TaxID=6334 RepID=UPI0001EFD55F|nr:hypothetical protein Tsp_05419 [Trichinella spiralis]
MYSIRRTTATLTTTTLVVNLWKIRYKKECRKICLFASVVVVGEIFSIIICFFILSRRTVSFVVSALRLHQVFKWIGDRNWGVVQAEAFPVGAQDRRSAKLVPIWDQRRHRTPIDPPFVIFVNGNCTSHQSKRPLAGRLRATGFRRMEPVFGFDVCLNCS